MHMRLKLEGRDLFMSDDVDFAKKPRTDEQEDTTEGADNGKAEANGKEASATPATSTTCVYVDS